MSEFAQLFVNGLIEGSIFALGAVGISIVLSTLDIGTLMHGDYMAFGAYIGLAANITWGLNPAVAFVVGAALTGVVAVAVDLALLRPFRDKGADATMILTLGIAMALRGMTYLWAGAKGQQFNVDVTTVFQIGLVRVSIPQLVNIVVCAVAIVALAAFLSRTQMGKTMRALANDRDLAAVAGVNVDRMRINIWIFAGFFAGLAGAMLGLLQAVFTPELGWNIIFLLFTAVILGGVGSIYGTLVGGLALGLVTELSTWSAFFGGVDPVLKPMVGFTVLIAVLLVRPRGMFGKAALV